MKKIVPAILIMLTAALLFTGCGLLDGMFGGPEGVDGAWIGSYTIDTGSKPYTMYSGKIVISGNTAKWYMVDSAYTVDMALWIADGQTGTAPKVSWDTTSIPGTVKQSGSSLKINFNGFVMNGTLSSNKKSFTYTDSVATYTYKKQ